MQKIQKSTKEWQAILPPDLFYISRQKGTEPPFSGRYLNCKDEGIYRCACCNNALFSSKTKFDSKSGLS